MSNVNHVRQLIPKLEIPILDQSVSGATGVIVQKLAVRELNLELVVVKAVIVLFHWKKLVSVDTIKHLV